MRDRLALVAVCLGMLVGIVGLCISRPHANSVATRYHAAQRTSRFYHKVASNRGERRLTPAPAKKHEASVVSSEKASANLPPKPNTSQSIR